VDPSLNEVPGIVAWTRQLPGSTDYRAYAKDTERAVTASGRAEAVRS
jgi:hypothetical protein